MSIDFVKYHGTGNDFILVDNRKGNFPDGDEDLIKRLCHRHYGIGSDGLMLLSSSQEADMAMQFYNPDASQSLCGNGSRCAVAYAYALGMIDRSGVLLTTDGLHRFVYAADKVAIELRDVSEVEALHGQYFIHTGSPHLVVPVHNADAVNVASDGAALRHSAFSLARGGVNVNFTSPMERRGHFRIRTFERGVEAETLSCGTGVTAAALAMAFAGHTEAEAVMHTSGGLLEVSFAQRGTHFSDIWLSGPATYVFSGTVDA